MKKNIFVASITLLSVILLTGCACKHEWKNATCEAPKTCALCNETEGEAFGHAWVKATCTTPITCSICETTKGDPLEHTWIDATCSNPKTCSVCNETEGEAMGHTWVDATCSNPKTCSICNEAEGDKLEHTWIDATCSNPKTCSVCNETEGAPLGHHVTNENIIKNATCIETGISAGECAVCKEIIETSLPMIDHTSGEWIVVENPTKYSEGTRIKKCTVCEVELEQEHFSLSPEELEQLYKNECEYISYNDLARTPKDYTGKQVKFSGYVVQVCSEASSALYYSTYRVATSGRYDNVVYALIDNYDTGVRILEDDYITIYGEFDGLYTYETVRGDSVTIPKIVVEYYD